ncbi:protein of unknown function (plasmid) [Azospirillum baldaniorum]|uniref:Uncharacterized protein n=1 Tax=Azospirillum baldaniorum TaxID=1064539 RepID=A0A9P1NRR9_9PROT|nr:protein of unknown function [Azospirillum baldaniorum]
MPAKGAAAWYPRPYLILIPLFPFLEGPPSP